MSDRGGKDAAAGVDAEQLAKLIAPQIAPAMGGGGSRLVQTLLLLGIFGASGGGLFQAFETLPRMEQRLESIEEEVQSLNLAVTADGDELSALELAQALAAREIETLRAEVDRLRSQVEGLAEVR